MMGNKTVTMNLPGAPRPALCSDDLCYFNRFVSSIYNKLFKENAAYCHLCTSGRCYNTGCVNPVSCPEFLEVDEPRCSPFLIFSAV